MNIVLILLMVFSLAWLVIFVMGVSQYISIKTAPTQVRLEQIARRTPLERTLFPEMESEMERRQRPRRRREPLLPTLAKFLSRAAIMQRLERELNRAGSPLRASELIAISAFLAAIVLIALAYALREVPLSVKLLIPLLVTALFLYFPFWYVGFLHSRWLLRFERYFPETLTMIAGALRSGLSPSQAFQMVADEGNPPINEEFAKMQREIEAGIPREQALLNLANRVNTMEMELLVTAILVQQEVGGRLADIMDLISNTVHERIRIRGEVRTLTALGRFTALGLMLLPIIMGIVLHIVPASRPFGLWAMLTDPGLQPAGRTMLLVGFCMQLVGLFWIRRIINIQV